jgi:hypothetical protein
VSQQNPVYITNYDSDPNMQNPVYVTNISDLSQVLVSFILVDALPTPTVALRGNLVVLKGTAGNADILYVCVKDSSNAYVWYNVLGITNI